MSSIMYRKEINVAESAEDMGVLFARSEHDIQVAFLLGWLTESERWSWPMQCRYITDDFPKDKKTKMASMLKTLVEHLEEA